MRKRLCVTAAIVLVPVLLLAIAWYCALFQTAEERLAAVERARMVPDSENAGVLYTRLSGSFFSANVQNLPSLKVGDAQGPRNRAWSSGDYPQLVEWIEGHEGLVSELLGNLRFENCYLPLLSNGKPVGLWVDWTGRMLPWVYLLVWSANNDIAEQRIDEAIEKYASAMRMSAHLYQQPARLYFNGGLYLEMAWANEALKEFVLDGRLSEEQLERIEAALLPAGKLSQEQYREMCRVETLFSECRRVKTSLMMRLKLFWLRIRSKRIFVVITPVRRPRDSSLYLRVVAHRRALRILIALRRHKDRSGRWPESLGQIVAQLPKNIFTDPQNGDGFVYRLTEGGFTLYSTGPNGIDEGGSGVSDDLPIWSSRMNRPNAKEERVDDEQ